MRRPGLAVAIGLIAATPALALGDGSPLDGGGGASRQAASTNPPSPTPPTAEHPAVAEPGLVSASPRRPALQGTSAGTVLQEAVKGTSAASPAGRTIGSDAAAINYPTVDSAFASSDGIAVPDAADQTPGKERLTQPFEQSELFTGSGDVRVKHLLGSGVFTTAGDRLGTIRDVLLTPGSEPQIILDANGRTIEVPWSKVEFALPGSELHGQTVLPGATRHVLEQLPEFRPQDQRGSG